MSELDRFPRVRLGHLPTPLEPIGRLAEAIGGGDLWIKRDDCTGLGTGGNKTRKLEFLLADARAKDCDTVITAGGVQSNHARQTAAAAARLDLDCHLVLEDLAAGGTEEYASNGNLLLDRLMGARVHRSAEGTDLDAAMALLADELSDAGARPYVVPVGGSNPLGALGYVACIAELLAQASVLGLDIDYIIHASGSAGTQAGLIAGLHLGERSESVLGICVSRDAREQEQRVRALAAATLELLGCHRPLPRESVRADSSQVGRGYGHPTPAALEALELAARHEGLLLDPVYTAKAMAGLVECLRRGTIGRDATVVFLHTGGSPALFAYRQQVSQHLAGH